MSYYGNFLSWFYSNKNKEELKGAGRNALNGVVTSNMVVVTKAELDSTINKLKHVETIKKETFDPMNDMVKELHIAFKKKKLGIYSFEEQFNVINI